ncbi:hypothetical protein SteCoe_10220 [Stentor coeruleus]|uniref:Uncharacterized protein n=1 Tax=Stentor coeruleus TaxID=5963 RepID=A0A1R2CG25_9CILI|nr:hypothetical protein SteCoe_10220 [Stentor coeruleus]
MEGNFQKLMVEQTDPTPKSCMRMVLSFICPCLFQCNKNSQYKYCCCLCCLNFHRDSPRTSELPAEYERQLPRINETNSDDSDFVSMTNSSFTTTND